MPHFDILIIGAGSAGSVLANRLSADPACRVGVLEAGGMPTDPDIDNPLKWPFIQGRDYDWAFETIPQAGTAGRVHPWPRGRIFGGSSCLHAMAHVRGHRDDFAPWAEATGSSRWSYEGLLPSFIAMEDFSGPASAHHGKGGPLPVWIPHDEVSPVARAYMRAGEEIGAPVLGDHNGEHLNGLAPNSLTIRDGKRVSAAQAYLFPILSRPNLTLQGDATVHRLIMEAGRIAGVEVTIGGQDMVYSADTVILAAGSVANPLLLMRSGVGDPETLAKAGVACSLSRSQVGRNLHDHLLGSGNAYRSRQPVPASRLQHSESLMYLNAKDPSIASGKPDVVLGCVIGPSASEALPSQQPGEAYTLLFGVTHPTSRGDLKISGPDIANKPIIDPAYLQTENDRRLFRRALDYARMVGQASAMDDWRGEEILPGSKPMSDAEKDAFIAKAVITHHHPVGTCRMGKDETAVVNADLKLNGLDNLYIVDASVIPSITSGPVHAAVLAIAETFAATWRP
ncbi:pyridoxine 4-oxidase [Rhizobium sp. SG_E_25_P2]|uniref:GMC family oxidoreductase n=1 Tax=Rhizobium sp. SG_E_25_P2 TaxID=2879942 RepID=UPI0024733CD0|nr:GMC family oxidoreductase N-terminal domain-containing protein [Rhizobium sp. SG_E_25_P2]MDH6264862.1 pyridoxine 4-oxidase [Rhizobium sp. SG_E_25_P2]